MKSLKYADILARNRELGQLAVGHPYRIALLSNLVINQLGEILEFVLRTRGINAEVVYGDYDNIVQDSIRLKDVDAVVIFWEAANLVDGLHACAEIKGAEELAQLGERVEHEMELVLGNLRDVPLVLVNKFSGLLFTGDDLRDGALQRLCNRLNVCLDRLVSPHQILIKVDKVLAQVGLRAAADFRQLQSAKALYSIEFLKSYAEHVAPAFLAVAGRMRKVLVLDCDNTLWRGILGEDGESQIQMNASTPQGRVFREVQQILKGFRKQGILLALCSKNNVEDVDRILIGHPDMLLREDDLVAKKINWQDKATNLRQLSEELNLGLDSFVFVDDSAFEIGLVQDELPMVICVKVPETLSDYPAVMRSLAREFFVLVHTSEDFNKTEMYRQEQVRMETKARFASLDDYLSSLGLVVRIASNEAVSMARAAQLTQKTNQFNLTTRRYTEADLVHMLSEQGFVIILFAVSDCYGDYGITGLAIVKTETEVGIASIDTLLMSCRIIGRNVERVFFDYLVGKLQAMGIARLRAEYLRTPKNDQVSDFYDSLGFRRTIVETDLRKYDLKLADYQKSGIDYIEVKEDVG
jgi:FkbH-like protein